MAPEQLVTNRRRRTRIWCLKYFWEGQTLDSSIEREGDAGWSPLLEFYKRHRRSIAFLLPLGIVHLFWWGFMLNNQLLYLFADRYTMSITMGVASLIAGTTSEGGGAVAFPVMVLLMNITPTVARDFIVMIQSIGMMAAGSSILMMKVQIEWMTLLASTVGGMFGIIFGYHCVDPYLSPSYKKMIFASICFSFAFALFLLNRKVDRKTFNRIPDLCFWKVAVLLLTGLCGGIFSSIAGNGLDVFTFSVITLLFCVSEKVATPTSIVLMAINSCVGWYWRHMVMGQIEQESFHYLYVSVPVVVIGAPLGSIVGTHFHRLVLAALIYILETVTLVAAFILVPQTPLLIGVSISAIVVGFVLYYLLTMAGNKLLADILKGELPEEVAFTERVL